MATIELTYAGLSLGPRKICNTIYQEGWKEIVDKGYDEPIKQDNNGVHHIVAKQGAKQVGVISWYVDDAYKVPQVVVMMAYVRPEYRKQDIFNLLHCSLARICEAKGWGAINYTVHKHNKAMRKAQDSMLSASANIEYQIYQHKINL